MRQVYGCDASAATALLERGCFAFAVFGEKRCGYNASAATALLECGCFAYAVFGEKRCGYNASAMDTALAGIGLLNGAEATPQTLFAKSRTFLRVPIAKKTKQNTLPQSQTLFSFKHPFLFSLIVKHNNSFPDPNDTYLYQLFPIIKRRLNPDQNRPLLGVDASFRSSSTVR